MPAIISIPTVGLYYLDQYLDLGITDSIIKSINDALAGEAEINSINIPYLIWEYAHDGFLGAEIKPELQFSTTPIDPKDDIFETVDVGAGTKSSLQSCATLGDDFLNKTDCQSSFSFGSNSCAHPYYDNEQKYCCPIGKHHSQKSILGIVDIPICVDDNPRNLYECSTTFSGICSTNSSDHYGSVNCWSSQNHMEVWCCGSNELNPDGSCKDVVPRPPGWQDI